MLYSGYNNYMIGNKHLFTIIDTFSTSEISLGVDSRVQAQYKDIISILTKLNENKSIHNVFNVCHLKHNLISVGKLSQNGYYVRFKGTRCIILDKSINRRLIAK